MNPELPSTSSQTARSRTRELTVCPALCDRQYVLAISQLSNSLVRGCVGSLFLDRGENFIQSRAYQQGDATSNIDWKASGRSHQLVVKEHESLRQKVVSLVVDRSGSMTAGAADHSKYAAASILCGGLAMAALKSGNPVSMVLSDAPLHPPPTLSTSQVTAAVMAMRRYTVGENTVLSRCLGEAFARAGRKQLLFILSDFHDPCASARISLLATHHEVVLIRLVDALETRTPAGGTMCIRPAEGGPVRYARAQRPRPSAGEQTVEALGLPTVTIDSRQPVSRQLSSFLNLRKLAV